LVRRRLKATTPKPVKIAAARSVAASSIQVTMPLPIVRRSFIGPDGPVGVRIVNNSRL